MDRPSSAKRFAGAAAVGALALLAASAAQARTDVYFSIGLPAAPVYYEPAPVYVQPRPVYVQPRPVYSQPYPVYVQPLPIYAPGHHYRGHQGGWQGRSQWNPHDWNGYRGDRDGDGVRNRNDRDRDGDGINNRRDRAPDDRFRY